MQSLTYKTTPQGDLSIHIFTPEKSPNPTAAIVFFFGGGWVGGNPQQFFPHCEHLASKGIFAASAQYRTKTGHGTSPFECVEDGKSAVRWLRQHAQEHNIDPNRLAAGGGSAGGHVAACTGVIDGYDLSTEDLAISSQPNALVLFNPVIDTTENGYGAEKLSGRTTDISPTHHVRPHLPPTVIFHGKDDTTVPFENVERFTRLMKESGNTCILHAYPDKKHGFFNHGRDDGAAYTQTVAQMDQFLTEQGYL